LQVDGLALEVEWWFYFEFGQKSEVDLLEKWVLFDLVSVTAASQSLFRLQ
jgi:hypothetical protein